MTSQMVGLNLGHPLGQLQSPLLGLQQEKRANREGHCPELVIAERGVFYNFQSDLCNAENDGAVSERNHKRAQACLRISLGAARLLPQPVAWSWGLGQDNALTFGLTSGQTEIFQVSHCRRKTLHFLLL